MQSWSLIIFLTTLALLSGCTQTLLVEGKFPSPLINNIPVNAGVMFTDEFKNYVYEESNKERGRWVIDIGEAQTDMMQAVLPKMFASLTEVESIPVEQNTNNLELIIVPSVEAFQYTLPSETRIKIYEIFLKYNIQVFEPDGTVVADWILTSYGKTPTGFMQSDQGALNQAIVIALRDAGANLSLSFHQVPEIRAWLEQH